MNVDDIINYYANLLIIQYHDQPKAQATIELFAKELLASNILIDIQDAYDIDTAVGVQLDVIGKYAGVNRYYSELDLEDFFSLITYDETSSLPSSPPRFGFSDYTTYENYSYNGTLVYADLIAKSNALTDDTYRTLIKLKIILNNSNFSHQQIDTDLFNVFGNELRAESLGNMTMAFFITGVLTPLIQAIIFKKLLPRPMGVGAAVIGSITGEMFAFTDYAGAASPFGYGFSDYSNYATLPGQVLTYSQITEG